MKPRPSMQLAMRNSSSKARVKWFKFQSFLRPVDLVEYISASHLFLCHKGSPRLTIPRSVTAAPSSYTKNTEETTGPKAYDISGIQAWMFPKMRRMGLKKKIPQWLAVVTCCNNPGGLVCRKSTVNVRNTRPSDTKSHQSHSPPWPWRKVKVGSNPQSVLIWSKIQERENFIKTFLTGLVTQNKWLQHGDRDSRGSKFDSGQSRPRLSSGKVPSSANSSPVESTATRGSR